MTDDSKRSRPFSEIEPRRQRFLWQGIPAGVINVIGGLPGKGKSLVTFRIAADISHKSNVLISNTEDRRHQSQRPRMQAAGANLDNVHEFDPRLRPLPEGFDQLAEEIKRVKAKLVVLDPWAAHCTIPAGDPARIRDVALDPVDKLCERTGCTVLIVTHQIKNASPNANPLTTVGGANAGLIGMARAVFLVGTNPEDAEQYAMVPAKFNMSEWPPGLVFELDEGDYEGGFLHLRGESDLTASKLVEAQYKESAGPKQSKSERAAEWLSRYLWMQQEPVEPKTAAKFAAMEDPPITARQLKRAAQNLGATAEKGSPSAAWELPADLREMLDQQYGAEDDG